MRATLTQLRGWNPETLATAGAHLAEQNRVFDDAMKAMERHLDRALGTWQGDAATAASARALSEGLSASHISTAVVAAAEAFNEAAAALTPARKTALAIASEAGTSGFIVFDDGRVVAPTFTCGSPVLDMLFQAQLNERAKVFEARLIPALDSAGELDAKAGAALSAAIDSLEGLQHAPDGGGLSQGVLAIIDGNGFLPKTPKELADYWKSLAPADKDALAAYDPSLGNRDGLPAEDKSRFNEKYLDELRTTAQSSLADSDRQRPDWARGENIPPDQGVLDEATQQARRDYDAWLDAREPVQTQIAGYDAVRAGLDQGGPPKYLMNIDDQGRAAIAIDNPDTADNVATFVPGTTSTLPGISGDMLRSQSMLNAAQEADGTETTAVVNWYGYNAPQTVPEAAENRFAEAGADRLDSFQDGLRASHDGPPSHNTVIGHSYGSTVIGEAATGGGSLAVDNLVFAGSPGVKTDNVEGLRLDGIDPSTNRYHVYATGAATDPVPIIGDLFGGNLPILGTDLGHGPNPARGSFGAQVFEGNPGSPTFVPGLGPIPINPSTHSDYWEFGNPALQTMGRIIVGEGVS